MWAWHIAWVWHSHVVWVGPRVPQVGSQWTPPAWMIGSAPGGRSLVYLEVGVSDFSSGQEVRWASAPVTEVSSFLRSWGVAYLGVEGRGHCRSLYE